MSIDKNNNRGVVWRVAGSNLMGNKLHSFFTVLTIILAVSLISGLAMVQKSGEKEKQRILDTMQQVMYMNITDRQMEGLAGDRQTELLVPYKEGSEIKESGVKMYPFYIESRSSGIVTFTPQDGKVPEQENEIAVDIQLLKALGKEVKIGTELELSFTEGEQETFVVCGLMDRGSEMSKYPVYVSKAYADRGAGLWDIPYTALVKIVGAGDMQISEFAGAVDALAVRYGIERNQINVNGNFEYSLQKSSMTLLIVMVGIIVLFAAAVVIYSIFYLSVTGRIQQIGQLRTIGMTKKQINRMIRREGLMLSAIAIPVGIGIGNVFAYFIKPDGWDVKNCLLTACACAAFGILSVLFSVGKPAKMAGSVSPVEAVRYAGDDRDTEGKDRPHKRLSAWTLAKSSRNSNRKKGVLTTVSLAIGGVLFMVGAAYMAAWDTDEYSRMGEFEDWEYIVDYAYDAHGNAQKYGITDLQRQGTLDDRLKEQLEHIPHVRAVLREITTQAIIRDGDKEVLVNVYPVTEENKERLDSLLDEGSTDTLKDDAVIIVNNKMMRSIFDISLDMGNKVGVEWYNGSVQQREVQITGVRESSDVDRKLEDGIYITEQAMDEMWSGMNKTSSFLVTAEDFRKNGETIEANILDILDEHKNLRLRTLREKKIDDEAQIKNLNTQIYGLTVFIIIFSIFNMINTNISSITARRREFAMLESIGMEKRQIMKMLCIENIYLAIPNILITFAAGGLAGFGTVWAFRKFVGAAYMHYQFPVAEYCIYAVCMLLVPMLITAICLSMQNKDPLVTRINYTD